MHATILHLLQSCRRHHQLVVCLHLSLQFLSCRFVKQVHWLVSLQPLLQQPSCWFFGVDELDDHVVDYSLRPDALFGSQALILATDRGYGRENSTQSLRDHSWGCEKDKCLTCFVSNMKHIWTVSRAPE